MVFIARHYRWPKSMYILFVVELLFVITALALFAIAQPDLYRTLLWQDGADNGFNSSPVEVLYGYANHKKFHVPLVWSYKITDYNEVLSIFSAFVLLVKTVMFIIHFYPPICSIVTHVILVGLYCFSAYGQAGPDTSDPEHLQKGAPWYITKSCSVVHTQSNYKYCEQAKACFGVTICIIFLYAVYLGLAIWSSFPTEAEKLARLSDLENYSPDMAAKKWEAMQSPINMQTFRPSARSQAGFAPTPRTVAFQNLEGGKVSSPNRTLPFRERYGGPDGR